MEEDITQETKEKLDEIKEFDTDWGRYLSITTAFIVVIAAIASLQSNKFSDQAILKKNDAVLAETKASDQWNYYQAKGIKKTSVKDFTPKPTMQHLNPRPSGTLVSKKIL